MAVNKWTKGTFMQREIKYQRSVRPEVGATANIRGQSLRDQRSESHCLSLFNSAA